MFFRLKTPSVSAIRAKFILERLQSLNSSNNISLCATGRTGSGKTTLGNRLVGIDYFMPSTGNQDCTDEINLIAFTSGIKYFDTPGVGSDETLENYNRVALGLKQVEFNFPPVQNLTLATYSQEGTDKTVNKQHFDVGDFSGQLHPDLIFYMVAVHQQFLNADCIYLKDLLTCYPHQVVYVLNIFADKETGTISYGTEQNVIDIVKKIKKVHNFVLGSEKQPIIVPVNCWTGEGISQLLTHSHEIIGSEKGNLVKQLIKYQQEKTPDEYVNQVQQELLRLFAHAACQKPEGTYTCDQSLHKCSDTLLTFVSELQAKSQQHSYHLGNKIHDLIREVLHTPSQPTQQGSNLFFDDAESIGNALVAIQEGIDSLNDKINNHLNPCKQEALQFRDQEVEKIQEKIIKQSEMINNLESELKDDDEQGQSIREEIQSINNSIESRITKHNSLVEDYKPFNETLNRRIDRFNSNLESLQSLAISISQRIDNYDSRRARLNSRITSYNNSWKQIKANPYASVSKSTIDSLKAESDSIDRETSSLNAEQNALTQAIKQRDEKIQEIEKEERSLNSQIAERDRLRQQIEKEDNLIEQIHKQGISKVNLLQNKENQIKIQLKERSKKWKSIEDAVMYYQEIYELFEQQFAEIEEQIDARIKNINSGLDIIKLHLLLSKQTEDHSSQQLKSLQQEINNCLEEIAKFDKEINLCQNDLKLCMIKLTINQIIMELLIECTVHHFDEVEFCEYKGSSYNYFAQKAVTFLLTIAHLIIAEKSINIEYQDLQVNFKNLIDNVKGFPSKQELTESRVFNVLKSKNDWLFSSDFTQSVKKIAM
jgi:predicted  nucleic acid-binding Zn-ribbon protein